MTFHRRRHTRAFRLLAAVSLTAMISFANAESIATQSCGPTYDKMDGFGFRLFGNVGEAAVGKSSGSQIFSDAGFVAAAYSLIINQAPQVSSDSVVAAKVNVFISYEAKGTDRESVALVGFINIPSWMNVNGIFISGTPTKDIGDTSFGVVATDGSLSDTLKVHVAVLTPNTPVKITSSFKVSAIEHVLFNYRATVLDPSTLLSLSFPKYPSWLHVSSDSLWGIPPEGATDTSFIIVATGASSSDIDTVKISVKPVNDPPVITSSALKGVITNMQFAYTADAYDPEGRAVKITFENLPSWLLATGNVVEGMPLTTTVDTSFIVVATDDTLVSRLSVQVRVQFINTPPVITSADTASSTQHRAFVYRATASDLQTSDLVILFPSQFPAWLTAQGDSVFGTPHTRGIGTISFTVKVSDGISSVTKNVFVSVKDSFDTPIFVSQPDTQCISLADYSYQARASDYDTTSLLFALAKAPATMTINAASGVVRWSPTDADTGTKTITINADDQHGGIGAQTFSLHVILNPAPRCKLGQIAKQQRNIVRIPFVLSDSDNEKISLALVYRLSPKSAWISSTAILGGDSLDAAHYTGTLQWNTAAENNLAGKRFDSLMVRITPLSHMPGFSDSTPFIVVDNTPALQLTKATPVQGTRVAANAIPTITVSVKSGSSLFDAATVNATTVTLIGTHQGTVPITVTCTDSMISVRPYFYLQANDLFTVHVSSMVKDKFGKSLDGNSNDSSDGTPADDFMWSFRTGYLGDFSGNDTVGFEDLTLAAQYWNRSAVRTWQKTDSIQEAGPAVGSSPYFVLSPDSLFDYRDLSVFMRDWYWTYGQQHPQQSGSLTKVVAIPAESASASSLRQSSLSIPPAISIAPARFQCAALTCELIKGATTARVDLRVENISGLVACRYRIWGSSGIVAIETNNTVLEKEAEVLALTRENPSWSEASLARFSSGDVGVSGSGTVATLWLPATSKPHSRLTLEYQLLGSNNTTIEQGTLDLGDNPALVMPALISQRIQPLVSAPNPMKVSSRNAAFEIIDQPKAISWVLNDGAGAVIKFQIDAQKGTPDLHCQVAIYNFNHSIVRQTPVRDIADEVKAAQGSKMYSLYWNGRDEMGMACAPGVYMISLLSKGNLGSSKQTFLLGIKDK